MARPAHINQGFYIDVGANDPLADSVTKVFYDAGWRGINIEPLPACHRALTALRPRDVNLALAAGLLGISRSVADEAAAWVAAEKITRATPLQLAYFHLGANIAASAPSIGLPAGAAQVFAAIAARPSFLMVGTVEPRKGHAQALAAFELLWRDGADVNLIVAGKQGWLVDKLAARLQGHAENERRLFWLPGVSDEMLLGLHARCAALLAPSEGEGVGLPLIEAAQHGVPIIARDIAVFREVAGEHAYFFRACGGSPGNCHR